MQSHAHSHAGHSHAGHSHGHDHGGDFQNISVSFLIAVGANLIFTMIEAVYAVITGSASLLADAGHNLSDVLGLLLAWGAAYLATRHTSEHYSYGFRRTTILAAIINAVVLIVVSVFIAIESFEKLLNPSEISEVAIMVVATIGIFVNAGSAWLFHRDSKEDLNIRGAYLHLAFDALVSAGVVLAALAMMFTGWLWIDGLVGILIVGVIVWGTWGLLRNSINMILDAVPDHIDPEEVSGYLHSVDGVHEVHDLHIWAMSTRETCLTAHLVMPENTLWESESGYADIGTALKDRFRIHHVTLQIERHFDCATQDCD